MKSRMRPRRRAATGHAQYLPGNRLSTRGDLTPGELRNRRHRQPEAARRPKECPVLVTGRDRMNDRPAPGQSSGLWPVPGWCIADRESVQAGAVKAPRARPRILTAAPAGSTSPGFSSRTGTGLTAVGGSQVAPYDLRANTGRSPGSRRHDSSSGHVWQRSAGPLRAPGRWTATCPASDRPAGPIAGPGRLAGRACRPAGRRSRASDGLPGCQDHEDIRGRLRAGRRQRVPPAAGRRFRGAYHGA